MTVSATYGVSGSLIAASPDGSRLYLRTPNTVLVIDAATGAAVAAIPATDTIDVAVSAAGDRLYIAQGEARRRSIRVIDTVTYLPLDTIVICDSVRQLGLTDDGVHLYALTSSRILDISTASSTITGEIGRLESADAFTHLTVAGGQLFVMMSRGSGAYAFEYIVKIDVATRAQVFLYAAQHRAGPDLLEVSSDGGRVFAWAPGDWTVHIDVAARRFLGTIQVPGGPVTLAAIPTPGFAQVFLDQPGSGSRIRQPATISGWAADNTVLGPGPGVSTVHVWAHPAGGGAATFLGADDGRPRPDVGVYLGPTFSNSGFAVTVRGLEPGGYRLVAYAFSLATGQFSIVGEVAVTIEPAPQPVEYAPVADTRLRVGGRASTVNDALVVRASPSATTRLVRSSTQ
ncbi:MAG: hypothetical protein ABIX28_10820 [Vicinamibacterales bacterium]